MSVACYPPDDPRYIDPEELKHATLDQKIAYRKVVEEKRRNDNEEELKMLKKKEIRDKAKSYWMIGSATILASCIGASVLVWQEFRKDDYLSEINDTLERIENEECKAELYQERLSYVGGACEKMMKYHRNTWAELRMQGLISESGESVVE